MSVSDLVVEKDKLLPVVYKAHPRVKLQHKNKPQKNLSTSSEENTVENSNPKPFRPPGGVGLMFPQNFDILQARASLKKSAKTENISEKDSQKIDSEEKSQRVDSEETQKKVTVDLQEKVSEDHRKILSEIEGKKLELEDQKKKLEAEKKRNLKKKRKRYKKKNLNLKKSERNLRDLRKNSRRKNNNKLRSLRNFVINWKKKKKIS